MIPSLAGQFDSDQDEDVFELSVVVGPGAKLRKALAKDSPAIATLSWDVVRPLRTRARLRPKSA